MMNNKRVRQFIEFIVRWPRLVRVLMVALFALAVTLSFSPLVDFIYARYFFSMQTLVAPSLVSSAFGLLMYLLGWWLMVGTTGGKPAARPALLLYFSAGVFAMIFVGYLIVRGVSLVNIISSS